ncbi:Com family DNA-binding transcriptional regulator [Clostridium sp.]|uniref:Com family DNA-binding transcriptional regulator n=1 Tax=Clostridium sp. TaxID=1506 RepID=UPI0032173332
MFKKWVIDIEEIRCPYCKQLLLKAAYVKGEIKCIRCKKIIKLEIKQRTEPSRTIE